LHRECYSCLRSFNKNAGGPAAPMGPVSIRCRRVHPQLFRRWGLEARHILPWRSNFGFRRAR